jgi:hypothetical protein
MRIQLVVRGANPGLLDALYGPNEHTEGDSVSIVDGEASLQSLNVQRRAAFPTGETLKFVLDVGTAISVGIVGNWLYDKLRGRARRIVIDGHVLEVTLEDITRALRELRASQTEPTDQSHAGGDLKNAGNERVKKDG